jgi:hypothetical protein
MKLIKIKDTEKFIYHINPQFIVCIEETEDGADILLVTGKNISISKKQIETVISSTNG